MSSEIPAPLIHFSHRADLDVLVGRWGHQPHPRELPAVYQQMMDLALHENARFWLQDIRRRTLNDPDTTRWLFREFFPSMARRLGGRLYVAYLVGPTLQEAIVGQPGFVSAEYYDGQPFVVSFFGDEGAAMQWLQTHPADAPVS